jgi:UDP-N-acetylmuramoyl-L-alanyl-D-glutamate--2,6-diaminopimelate ligase
MEVSSHGLSQGRVNGLPITTAVFTNLTQDHLDYHGTFSAYAEAKKQLFTMPSVATVIVNVDDTNADLIINAVKNVQILTYALVKSADVHAKEIVAAANGTRFTLITPWGHAQVRSPLLGVFNIYNLLAAITVVLKQGVPLPAVVEAIQYLQPVAGRMQQLPIIDGIKVIVDFAHTPDGLEQALLALRDHIVGRIWVVFGCGGDRDKQKRALMGAIAEDLADEVILTSDNPRSENPQAIISDIAAGCKNAAYQIVDRQEAIAFAIEQAQAGDCILIAGKGHETYQLIQNTALPFCDVTIANALLQQKSAEQNNTPPKNQALDSPLFKEAK